jgi:hypothetical protein
MGSKKIASLVALAVTLVAVLLGILAYRTKPPEAPLAGSPGVEDSRSAAPVHTPSAIQESSETTEPYYSIEDFNQLTQGFKDELPPMEAVLAQPKHATHPGLYEAYRKSGVIARAAIRQPELRDAAFTSLEFCANINGYDLSVRAMCLRQHRKIRSATNDTSFDERNRIQNLRELDSLLKRSFDDD